MEKNQINLIEILHEKTDLKKVKVMKCKER